MAALLLLLATLTQAPATDPSIEELERAARQLSSDRFAEREAAAQQLWEAGRAATDVLRRVAESGDAEAQFRAREILDLHRFGMLPDTPLAQQRHIRLFRDGSPEIRKQILLQLHTLGELELMVRLVNAVDDPQQRDELLGGIDTQLQQSLRRLMTRRQWDRAERLLEMISGTSDGARHLVAFHLARGTLDDQIAHWKSEPEGPARARTLALLMRAQGDMPGALAWARQTGDEMLVVGLQMEMKQWQQLSDAGSFPTYGSSGYQYEELGFLSLIHQLAGERRRHEETLEKIYQLGQQAGGADQFRAVEALLVNERLERGMELLKAESPLKAMQVYSSQFRHVEALGAVEVPATADAMAARIKRTADAIKIGGKDTADLAIAVEVAVIAQAMGLEQVAEQGFDALAAASTSTTIRQPVIEGLVRSGRREQAFRHAVSSRYASVLFKNNTTQASHWYQLLKALDTKTTLEKIWTDADRLIYGRGEAPDWKSLERAVEIRSRSSGSYWVTLGEAALARDELERAEAYFRKGAERKYGRAQRALGDVLRRQQRWGEAAEAYTAASPERDDPVDTYLAGDCLRRAGEKEEGERLCQLAMALPLGGTRKELGTELRERGLLESARQCWEFDLRVQAPRSWEHHYAAQQLGNQVEEESPGLAADCWTQLTMSTMKAATTFNGVSSYVRMPSLINKMRARQAIEAEDFEAAQEHLDRSRRMMPGGISLAEDLVPLLDKTERGREIADTLHGQLRDHLLEGLKAFPDSALYHNNVAWLSARCQRDLDAALEHARRATSLRPDSAMYLDTLAEVQYQRGNREEAVALMRKCLELDPRGSHYQEQLERFQAGKP